MEIATNKEVEKQNLVEYFEILRIIFLLVRKLLCQKQEEKLSEN